MEYRVNMSSEEMETHNANKHDFKLYPKLPKAMEGLDITKPLPVNSIKHINSCLMGFHKRVHNFFEERRKSLTIEPKPHFTNATVMQEVDAYWEDTI